MHLIVVERDTLVNLLKFGKSSFCPRFLVKKLSRKISSGRAPREANSFALTDFARTKPELERYAIELVIVIVIAVSASSLTEFSFVQALRNVASYSAAWQQNEVTRIP